jgi:hypothetical protein
MEHHSMSHKEKVDSYISLYKQQMVRFGQTQGVEWKGNFGLWALLAGATYLVANKSVDVPPACALVILAGVCAVHAGWLVFVHDSQQIEKDLWVVYRDKAAAILGCVPEQQNALSHNKLFRRKPFVRKFFWTSFEVGMTILLCAILFVMLFYRTKRVDLNM